MSDSGVGSGGDARSLDECAGCGNERRIIQAGYCAECLMETLIGGGSFL